MKQTIELEHFRNLVYFYGINPFYTQGAGGNVSIKLDKNMIIKASGTKLSDILEKDIFVSVNYEEIIALATKGKFPEKIKSISTGINLNPSIETSMHALIPKKYVFHLHSISALINLISTNCHKKIYEKVGDSLNWEIIKYCKPGPKLAEEIYKKSILDKEIQVFFLQNHGITFASDTLDGIRNISNTLEKKLNNLNLNKIPNNQFDFKNIKSDKKYSWCEIPFVKEFAFNDRLIKFLKQGWRMCPDHIVFLGADPIVKSTISEADIEKYDAPFIFVPKSGVLVKNDLTSNQLEQLGCFYHVAVNCNIDEEFYNLSEAECEELINWDAEVLRLKMSKMD